MDKRRNGTAISILSGIMVLAFVAVFPKGLQKLLALLGKNGFCPFPAIGWIFLGATVCMSLLVFGAVGRLFGPSWPKLLISGLFSALLSSICVALVFTHLFRNEVMGDYCRGFADRIVKRVDVAQLEKRFETLSQRSRTNDVVWSLVDLDPRLTAICRRKSILVELPNSPETGRMMEMILLWKCPGGGIGLLFGQEPPAKRSWFDQATKISDRIWVIVRRE